MMGAGRVRVCEGVIVPCIVTSMQSRLHGRCGGHGGCGGWREGMQGVAGVISRVARHTHASVSWRMSHGRTLPASALDL